MDGMTVDSVELRNAAESLRKYVSEMSATLDNAKTTTKNTAGSWESAAAENLRTRFNDLSATFQDFYDAITNYATFLDNTATSYEEADKTVTSKADELLNNNYNA